MSSARNVWEGRDETERVNYLGTGIGSLEGAKRYLRRKFNQGQSGPVQIRPGAFFYVTLRRNRKAAFLLGPYVSHMSALSAIDRARALLAERHPDTAAFAAVGTASTPKRVDTRFGR